MPEIILTAEEVEFLVNLGEGSKDLLTFVMKAKYFRKMLDHFNDGETIKEQDPFKDMATLMKLLKFHEIIFTKEEVEFLVKLGKEGQALSNFGLRARDYCKVVEPVCDVESMQEGEIVNEPIKDQTFMLTSPVIRSSTTPIDLGNVDSLETSLFNCFTRCICWLAPLAFC